ncbi:MAG: hypothetical protein GY941_10280 [Planctomycetes bacterium]|nr:hypothetical protein [Planctomycetota bacterium]
MEYANQHNTLQSKKNGIEWTVRKGYEELQGKLNLSDLQSALNKNPHTVVKDTKVRSVFLIPDADTNNTDICVKYFKERDSRDLNKYLDFFKDLFIKTKAETEWDVGNRLLRSDINTALPLLIAEKKSWFFRKHSLLITRAISNSKSLMDFCSSDLHATASGDGFIRKKHVIDNLAQFVKDIHSKGFFHSDFHAGNILIQLHPDHTGHDLPYSLYLIDLHHVKMLKTLSNRKILYNIAQLFNSLASSLTQSDKQQFLKSYGNDRLGNTKWIREPVAQIDKIATRLRCTHYKSRLKRCLKTSSVFSKKKSGSFKLFFRKGHIAENFLKLVMKHDNALTHNSCGNILKHDRKTSLTRHPFKDRDIHTVVVKHYKASPVIGFLKTACRKSPGRKAWISGNGLLVYGFGTPLPLALIEKQVLGIVTGSYLIMEAVSGSLELDRYLVKNFEDPSGSRLRAIMKKKRRLINHFAQKIAEMHSKQVFHHDLKTCNIMVKDNSTLDFTFLDFDRVTFGKNVNPQDRIRTLTQINLSTPGFITLKDRLRFLGEYIRQSNLREEKRRIRNEIAATSQREKILYVSFKGDVTEDW